MAAFDGHPDAEIAALIAARRGRENAISIGEIAQALWQDDWTAAGAEGERRRRSIERRIKGAVARLVNHGGMVICPARVAPFGYFVPVSQVEVTRAVRASVRQAVKMLQRAKKLTGDPYYEELSGQLSLRL